MNEYVRIGGFVAVAVLMVIPALMMIGKLIEESRRWRRLMQLYFEKQVSAPLPVDEDPDAPAESALHLPADELDELEREDELEAEVRAQRLS